MANVEFYKGASGNLSSATKVDGAFYYTTDEYKLYISDGTNFHRLSDLPVATASSSDGVAYTATVTGIGTALVTGMRLIIIPNKANTGTSSTLNLNGWGAKSLKARMQQMSSATTTTIPANGIAQNKPLMVVYDGTQWLTDIVIPSASGLSGSVPISKGGTGATTAAAARTALGAASVTSYEVTVPTSGWTNGTDGYYKTISVSGIAANDEPIVDVILDSTLANNKLYLAAWYKISKITTADDSITLYAFEDAPTTQFKIKLKVVK